MAILKLLCRRRHETIARLASEFDVSERTIRRDVEILSYTEPIYTQPGRYGGGVYVTEGFTVDRMYFQPEEAEVIRKLLLAAETSTLRLTPDEIGALKRIATDYIKPEVSLEKQKRNGEV